MRVITHIEELQGQADDWRRRSLCVGLVPTMGFFHEGHLALMRRAASCCDRVVTSLFVNPTQFGPNEDLEAYPRDFARDKELAEGVGVDALFAPDVATMYREGHQTQVTVDRLTKGLCGGSRPDHFAGVATVVTKLFLAAKPHVAVFGQKDFQQLAVIRRLVADLNFDIEIIGQEIVRETDGLAMSSRNKYLSQGDRKAAVCLYEAIVLARKMYAKSGVGLPAEKVTDIVRTHIEAQHQFRVDYVTIVDPVTLEPVKNCGPESRLVLAVFVSDKVRLIDNAPLQGDF